MVHEVLIKVRDEKKSSPDSEFTLTASWCDEEQHSDDILEKVLFPIQKVILSFNQGHWRVYIGLWECSRFFGHNSKQLDLA